MAQLVRSHWHHSITNLTITPSEFYSSVEAAVQARKVPNVKVSRERFAEGAVLSATRDYLRVRRGEYYFEICGAPFADGSFVSWWLVEDTGCLQGCLALIPVLGWMLIALAFRETYYKVDTRLMFQDVIHSAVLEVVDGLTTAKGLRALSETERRPTLQHLLK